MSKTTLETLEALTVKATAAYEAAYTLWVNTHEDSMEAALELVMSAARDSKWTAETAVRNEKVAQAVALKLQGPTLDDDGWLILLDDVDPLQADAIRATRAQPWHT